MCTKRKKILLSGWKRKKGCSMKKKIHICTLVFISILLFSLIAIGEDVEKFQYTSNVEVHDNQDDFIIIEISPYAGMSLGFKDLRLYHKDQELDYLVFPLENQQRNNEENRIDIFNKGTIGNTYSFDIMPPKDMHVGDIQYSVKLNASQYLVKAKIYGSNDRKEWKYLRTQTIYGIDGEYNRFSLENIQYNVIKIEYELLDHGDMLEVNSVVYTQTKPILNKGALQAVDYTSKENLEQRVTEIIVDHQYKHPTTGIILESEEKYFYRQVTVSGSNDKESWTEITRTFIFRDAVSEKLDINYSPREYRYLRAMIENEDNQLLKINRIKAEVPPLYVLVNVSNQPKDFTIKAFWGNPSLPAPKYDITNLNITLDPQLYKKYEIHSYAENKEFGGVAKQLPLTERFLWLMPASLALLSVGVLVFLYKTIKQVG